MLKRSVVVLIFIALIIGSIFWVTDYLFAYREAQAPPDAVEVLEKYAESYPNARVDYIGRIGDRFLIGIVVFPIGEGLDHRYVMIARYKEWEPIAEFKRLR